MVKKPIKKSKAGGYRAGSGRPKGTGKYGELTQPMRIPVSLLAKVEALLANKGDEAAIEEVAFDNIYPWTGLKNPSKQKKGAALPGDGALQDHALPLYTTRVAAGFPSPADDHIERHLDLNHHLIQRPAATFFVRVEGESMMGAGIHENDILIVDRSLEATNGKIIIAVVNGELTVKRLKKSREGHITLMPENPRFKPLQITEEMDFRIWGVVIHVIHSV